MQRLLSETSRDHFLVTLRQCSPDHRKAWVSSNYTWLNTRQLSCSSANAFTSQWEWHQYAELFCYPVWDWLAQMFRCYFPSSPWVHISSEASLLLDGIAFFCSTTIAGSRSRFVRKPFLYRTALGRFPRTLWLIGPSHSISLCHFCSLGTDAYDF